MKRLPVFFVLLLAVLGFSRQVCGQAPKSGYQFYMDTKPYRQVKSLDSLEWKLEVNRLIRKMVLSNHLLCGLDSVVTRGGLTHTYIGKGPALSKVTLLGVEKYEEGKKVNDFDLSRLAGTTLSTEKFSSVLKGIVKRWANRGYPFASMQVLDVHVQADGIACKARIESGPMITYDSLVVLGKARLSKSFVKHYLGIARGKPYSERVIQSIEARVGTLSHLELEQAPLVVFRKNRATVFLRLKERLANKIDALVGFAPQSDNNNNKLLLTGQADIKLSNVTGNAEQFELFWQSFLRNSQSLNTHLYIPNLPYLNLGATLDFDLTKFDSNYLQTLTGIQLNFNTRTNFRWSVFYQVDQTSLLSADTNGIRSRFDFPAINATSIRKYGVSIEKNQWEGGVNPWKGYAFNVSAAIGSKRINRDNRIERVRFGESGREFTLYDTLPLSFNQYEFQLTTAWAIPLSSSRYVLYARMQGGVNLAEKIFFNELSRLGGFRTLKGFDEQSIFGNQYALGNLELRYRFNSLSNAFLFTNALYYKNEVLGFAGVREDIPFGFGLGANINTGNTVLSMAYGYGIQKHRPFNISKGKFHFGLVNYF